MSMALSDLRTEVLDHGFDANLFGSSRIDQYINDGYFKVCRRVQWYQDEATYDFATVVGTTNYSFPTDFMKGRSLRDTDRDIELQEVGIRLIDRSDNQSSGEPIYWTVDGPNIHVFPSPDGVYNLEFRYWKLPAALSQDTDVPILPDEYQALLIYWALKRAYSAEDDLQTAQGWEQNFNQLLAEFESDVRFPTTTYPDQCRGLWDQEASLGPRGWSLYGWGLE